MKLLAFVGIASLCVVGCASPSASRRVDAPAAKAGLSVSRRERVQNVLRHNVRLLLKDGQTVKRTLSAVVIGREHSSRGTHSFLITTAHGLVTTGLADPRITVLVGDAADAVEVGVDPLVISKDPKVDLALLRLPGVDLPPVALASDAEMQVGDEVLVAAAPYGRGVSVSGGMVSLLELDEKTNEPVTLKTDAAVGYGASGGGIYSLETGRLLAIVEGYRTARLNFAVDKEDYTFEVPMPGETFAAPSTLVRRFLEANGLQRVLSTSSSSERAGLASPKG